MLIKREDNGDVTILKVFGEINRTDTGDLRKSLEKILDEERTNVILDMEEIKFVSSFMIMMLLRLNREFLAAGGGIKLLKPRSVVKRFLSIGRVLELFESFDTRIDALKSFQVNINNESSKPENKIKKAGHDQRAVMLRLIEMLQEKGVIDSKEFDNEMNLSSRLVFQVFRQGILDDPLKPDSPARKKQA